MLYETLQSQVTRESLCPVPVLAFFPQSPSLSPNFHECHERPPFRPLSARVARIRSALSVSASTALYTLHTKHRLSYLRLLPLKTTSRCSDSAIVYCAPRGLEEWHRGWVGSPAAEADVSEHCAVAPGPGGHPRLWDQWLGLWPRGDTYCHNTR